MQDKRIFWKYISRTYFGYVTKVRPKCYRCYKGATKVRPKCYLCYKGERPRCDQSATSVTKVRQGCDQSVTSVTKVRPRCYQSATGATKVRREVRRITAGSVAPAGPLLLRIYKEFEIFEMTSMALVHPSKCLIHQ